MNSADDIAINGCVTGLGCIESSFLCQTCPCITDYQNPDLPALAVCLQYLIQVEVSTGWSSSERVRVSVVVILRIHDFRGLCGD